MGAPPSYERKLLARFLFDLAPWRDQASCANDSNPDRWFPKSDEADAIEELCAICEECPVRNQCAKYVLTAKVGDGVWAGFFMDPDHVTKSRGNVARWLRNNAPVDEVYRGSG